jgi:prevent-host-death family protein
MSRSVGMKKPVNIAEAKARLPELIDAALRGEEVIIARRNKPVVRLVVAESARPSPVFGKYGGRIRIAEDFDAPLPDFDDYSK